MSVDLDLGEDWHVHSRFSDGSGSLAENLANAERVGLTVLGCVEHVRRDSSHVPAFTAAVEELRSSTHVTLHAGVEAKMLDDGGALDLPPDDLLHGVDLIVIADHQVPSPDGPLDPEAVRQAIVGGDLARATVARWIVDATAQAALRHPGSLVAHLFSVLPKAGLSEADIAPDGLEILVRAAARSGATLEISERWKTPSSAIAAAFAREGVRVVASTDAHRPEDVGRYEYCRRAAEAAVAGPPGRHGAQRRPTWRAFSTPQH